MQTITSITDILKGQVYISELTRDSIEIEIVVGDFMIEGEIELSGYEVPRDWDYNIPSYYEIVKQTIYPTTLFDEEGEEIELSKSDKDVINAWFQTIKLDVAL